MTKAKTSPPIHTQIKNAKAMILLQNQFNKDSTGEEKLDALAVYDIEISKAEILEKYNETKSTQETYQYFYLRDLVLFEQLDSQEEMVSSDTFFLAVKELIDEDAKISKHWDIQMILEQLIEIKTSNFNDIECLEKMTPWLKRLIVLLKAKKITPSTQLCDAQYPEVFALIEELIKKVSTEEVENKEALKELKSVLNAYHQRFKQ